MSKHFDFIKNGSSDYKIDLNGSNDRVIGFAKDEIVNLVESATMVRLLEGDGNEPCKISLKVDKDNKSLNNSGFRLQIDEKGNVTLTGRTSYGVLYGCYEFLERFFGIVVYAGDEIAVPKHDFVEINQIDIIDNPIIEYRYLGYYNVMYNPVSGNRMRVLNENMSFKDKSAPDYGTDVYYGLWGGLWAHTMLKNILPVEKNADGTALHPDWYNEKQDQLCFTNPDADAAFIEKLKELILKRPGAPFYMLGIMDENGYCDCKSCAESHKRYGGAAGTHVRFINRIAKRIEQWRKKTLPDKSFFLAAFAYGDYKPAPVLKDEETGVFTAIDSSLVLNDNVAIMVAPLDACGIHNLNCDCNKKVSDRYKGWRTLCKNIIVWDYHAYFDNYMLSFPSLYALKDNIAFYREIGAGMVYCEGNLYDFTTGFQDLKVYLLSRLLWNPQQDPEKLTEDFIDNYYKCSAPYIKEYYNAIRQHYAYLEKLYAELGGRGYHTAFQASWQPDVLTERHWPEKFLGEAEKIFLKGLEKAEGITEKSERETVIVRVKRESLMIKYLILELHTLYCARDEYQTRYDEFDRLVKDCGIKKFKHWGSEAAIGCKQFDWVCRYPARVNNK